MNFPSTISQHEPEFRNTVISFPLIRTQLKYGLKHFSKSWFLLMGIFRDGFFASFVFEANSFHVLATPANKTCFLSFSFENSIPLFVYVFFTPVSFDGRISITRFVHWSPFFRSPISWEFRIPRICWTTFNCFAFIIAYHQYDWIFVIRFRMYKMIF